MDKEFLQDRFAGCLLGFAIGDAMGGPVNGMTPYEVMTRYHAPIDMFYPYNGQDCGQYTVETISAMSIAKAIDGAGRFDPSALEPSFAKIKTFYQYQKADGAKTVFGRFVAPALHAAGTGIYGQPMVENCKFIASSIPLSKKETLAAFLFADVIRQLIRSPKELSKPYELYDADRSMLIRMIQTASNSEAKLGEEGIEDRLSEKLTFLRNQIMDKNCDLHRFYGFLQPKGSIADALLIALFAYLRAPDDFVTVCKTVSMGGCASIYGAMVGALVGVTIGSSLLPQDMKDKVHAGLSIETLALSFAEKCLPKPAIKEPTLEEQENGNSMDNEYVE